ncbi:hypothetical protein PoB_007424300 [Plakobranchus ocellatus]|uniref:Uncharacterized protein n=1 Tax=Plakobranchus ocellatus TaxID=259542 RepID=A0AAV4DUF8_9GAST|nr:hypothetical protein PoB_007424300 [Plakobranchus ocellatus]
MEDMDLNILTGQSAEEHSEQESAVVEPVAKKRIIEEPGEESPMCPDPMELKTFFELWREKVAPELHQRPEP